MQRSATALPRPAGAAALALSLLALAGCVKDYSGHRDLTLGDGQPADLSFVDMYRPSHAAEVAESAWQALCSHDPAWRCARSDTRVSVLVMGDAPDCTVDVRAAFRVSTADPAKTTYESAEIACGAHRYRVRVYALGGPRDGLID